MQELCIASSMSLRGATDLSATRIPPGPDYTGGGGFSLPIDLTIYLCLIEFLGRPNQSHAHKRKVQEKSTKAKTSCKNSIDLRNSERGNPPGKSIQNRLKMLRWRCLGDALGLPGASQGPIRADLQRQPKLDEKMGGFCEAAGTSQELPGDPKINEKSIVCEQKALQTWILCRCLCTKPFSMIFV